MRSLLLALANTPASGQSLTQTEHVQACSLECNISYASAQCTSQHACMWVGILLSLPGYCGASASAPCAMILLLCMLRHNSTEVRDLLTIIHVDPDGTSPTCSLTNILAPRL